VGPCFFSDILSALRSQPRKFATEEVHGVADNDVAVEGFLGGEFGESEDFGFGEVGAKFHEKFKQ